MRILILSQYYDPEPVPKPADLARELARRGHQVHVLTGLPNYPEGRLYQGYRLRLLQREVKDGIGVLRTFEWPYHGRSTFGRMLNYGSFMLSAIAGSLLIPGCDVVYVWHPPLTVGVTAWIVARFKRAPFVYDVQDIWPESAVHSGMLKDGILLRLLSRLERFVYRRARRLLVVTEGAKENLVGKGVSVGKLSVMPHWVDESIFASPSPEARDLVRRKFEWDNKFVILFAGNIGMVQGLDSVLQAASLVRDHAEILFAFVGDGSEKQRLMALSDSLGLKEKVQFIDRQPMSSMPDFMAAADVLLVHLKKSPLTKLAIPSKTLAYLAAGRPILMAMEGDAAKLVEDAQAGILVEPDTPNRLAEAVLRLQALDPKELNEMGRRGRDFLMKHFSKATIIPEYEKILQESCSAPHG